MDSMLREQIAGGPLALQQQLEAQLQACWDRQRSQRPLAAQRVSAENLRKKR
jgi:hypothetical protein